MDWRLAMSEFVKPKKIIVNPIPYLQKITGEGLVKDLHDDEVLCETCGGVGLVLTDNPYGLSNDPNKVAGHFPYKHQSYTFCPDCYNGVVHRCKLCGELIRPRWNLKCNCAAQQALDKEKQEQIEQEVWDKAEELPEDLKDSYTFFYSEYYGWNNGYFEDWDSFFDYWNDNYEETDERPEYVWVTEAVSMQIDARDIVESATEEMYEDAMDNISDDAINNLQQFLNEWCRTCGVGDTYYESHKYKVKIPWEEYGD